MRPQQASLRTLLLTTSPLSLRCWRQSFDWRRHATQRRLVAPCPWRRHCTHRRATRGTPLCASQTQYERCKRLPSLEAADEADDTPIHTTSVGLKHQSHIKSPGCAAPPLALQGWCAAQSAPTATARQHRHPCAPLPAPAVLAPAESLATPTPGLPLRTAHPPHPGTTAEPGTPPPRVWRRERVSKPISNSTLLHPPGTRTLHWVADWHQRPSCCATAWSSRRCTPPLVALAAPTPSTHLGLVAAGLAHRRASHQCWLALPQTCDQLPTRHTP